MKKRKQYAPPLKIRARASRVGFSGTVAATVVPSPGIMPVGYMNIHPPVPVDKANQLSALVHELVRRGHAVEISMRPAR